MAKIMKNWFLYLLGFLILIAFMSSILLSQHFRGKHCIDSVIFIKGESNPYSHLEESCDHPKAHIELAPNATPSTFLCKCSE